jgi:hypothetical protein
MFRPIAFAAIALVLLAAGCNAGETSTQSKLPSVDGTPGRPPTAFPAGTSDADVVAEMRAHLQKLSADDPTTSVLGVVYLATSTSPSTLEELASSYSLRGGTHAAALVLVDGNLSLGEELTDPISAQNVLQTIEATIATLPPSTFGSLNSASVDPLISGFMVWATPEHLLALWEEHTDLVRAIGVAGRSGNLLGAWRLVKPGEPLR